MKPEVTRNGVLDIQVCVPSNWSNDEIKKFADSENPSGTQLGWQIRQEGSEYLNGDPERVNCSDREGFVHVMLDA